MSHETKIGVLVSCSFVCMVGAVIYLRMHDPAALSPPVESAELPGWAQPAAPAAPTAENASPTKTNMASAPVATGDGFRPNPIPAEIQRTTHVVPNNPTAAQPPRNPPTASVPNPLLGGGETTPAPLVSETPVRPSGPDVGHGGMPPVSPTPTPTEAAPTAPLPGAAPRTNVAEIPAPVDPHRPIDSPAVTPVPTAPAEVVPPTGAPLISPPPAAAPTVGGTEVAPPAAPHVPAPINPPVEPAAPVNPPLPAPVQPERAPLDLGSAPTNPLPGSVPPGPAPVVPPPVETAPGSVPPPNPIPSNPIPSNPTPNNSIPSNPIPSNPIPNNPAPTNSIGSNPAPDNVQPRGVILGSPETPAPRPGQNPGVMPEARSNIPPAGDTMPEMRNQVAQNLPAVNYPLPPVATQARPPLPGAPEVVSFNEETYVCKPGDTFASICKEKYYSEKYDRALLMFNRSHPMAADGIRNDPPVLKPGAEVYIPPMNILEKSYAALIPDLVPVNRAPAPVGGMAPVAAPAGGLPAAPGAFPSASRSSPGADRLYRVTEKPETLWEVAARTLGNGERWSDIFRMNPGVNSRDTLPVGTVLRLPPS